MSIFKGEVEEEIVKIKKTQKIMSSFKVSYEAL